MLLVCINRVCGGGEKEGLQTLPYLWERALFLCEKVLFLPLPLGGKLFFTLAFFLRGFFSPSHLRGKTLFILAFERKPSFHPRF